MLGKVLLSRGNVYVDGVDCDGNGHVDVGS